MSLRDLFAVKPSAMLHVATTRQCNMQQMRPDCATAHATPVQQQPVNPCVPTLSSATPSATMMQQGIDSDVAGTQCPVYGRQADATPASRDAVPDTEPAQDLPLLAACLEFQALIERLCDLSNHPADVRAQMRRVSRCMAPGSVTVELDAVRELVKRAEAGDAALADDRITCRDCANRRTYDGACKVAEIGGTVNAMRGYVPDATLPHRCAGFAPKATAEDKRTGAERWSNLGISEP